MLFSVLRQRLGPAIVTLWLAFTLAFLALRILPGDAVTATLIRSGASQEELDARRTLLGIADPIPMQYFQSIVAVFRCDLGLLLMSGRPVAQIIGEQFGATVVLAI